MNSNIIQPTHKNGFILNITILFGFAIASMIAAITMYIQNGLEVSKIEKDRINIQLTLDLILASSFSAKSESCLKLTNLNGSNDSDCDPSFTSTIANDKHIISLANNIAATLNIPHSTTNNIINVTTASRFILPIDDDDIINNLKYLFFSTSSFNQCIFFLSQTSKFDTIGISTQKPNHIPASQAPGLNDLLEYPQLTFKTPLDACASVKNKSHIWIGVKIT